MTSESPYQKREIDEKFTDIKDSLNRIEVQTTKTNGKVLALQKWQSFIQGGLAILALIIVPIVIYLIKAK